MFLFLESKDQHSNAIVFVMGNYVFLITKCFFYILFFSEINVFYKLCIVHLNSTILYDYALKKILPSLYLCIRLLSDEKKIDILLVNIICQLICSTCYCLDTDCIISRDNY